MTEISVGRLLENELIQRKTDNSRYSLRAFARDLEISPGFLSHLIKGEKSLSPDKASGLSKKWVGHAEKRGC